MLYALTAALNEKHSANEAKDVDVDVTSPQAKKTYQTCTKQQNDDCMTRNRNSKEKEVYHKFIQAKQQCVKQSKIDDNCKSRLKGIQTVLNETENIFGNAFGKLMSRFENVEIECNRKWKAEASSQASSHPSKSQCDPCVLMNNLIQQFEKLNSLYMRYQTEMCSNFDTIETKLGKIKQNIELCISGNNKNENSNDNSNINSAKDGMSIDPSKINFKLFNSDSDTNNNGNNEMKTENDKNDKSKAVGYWESDVTMKYKSNGSRIFLGSIGRVRNPFGMGAQWSAMQFESLKCSLIQWVNESVSPNRDIMYLLPNMEITIDANQHISKNCQQCVVCINQAGTYRINCVMQRSLLNDNQFQNEYIRDCNYIVKEEQLSDPNFNYEVTELFVNNEMIEFKQWDNGQPIPKIEINVIKSLQKNDKIVVTVCHGLPQMLKASLLVEKLG